MLIFHIASASDWAAAHLDGSYTTSTRGLTLQEQGFIHCSRYFQVSDVLDRFYADFEGRLVLLTINPRRLTARWQLDEVAGEAATYPHVYGPINPSAVITVTPITRDRDGRLTHEWFLPGPLAAPRLVLRAGTDADWPTYRRTLVEEPLRRYLGGAVGDAEADGRRGEVSSKGCVAVERNGQVVGFVLLGFYRTGDFEVSYSFLPEHHRHGYAREAVSNLMDWVFAVFSHLPRVIAVTQVANTRSVALLRELNWTETDHFVEWGEPQVMYSVDNPRQI